MKICVIDDELEVRVSIIQKLTTLFPNEDIFDVGFGRRALEQINVVQPDLIFLDIRMPEISGIEILNEIKQTYPKMHVIIISGYDDFEYARKALQYGALDYLLKPADRGQLREIVEKVQQQLNSEFYKEFNLLFTKLPSAFVRAKDIKLQLYNTSLWFDERRWKKFVFGDVSELIQHYETPKPILCSFSVEANIEGLILAVNQGEPRGTFREKEDFFPQFQLELKRQKQRLFYQTNDIARFERQSKSTAELGKKLTGIRQTILNDARTGDDQKLERSLGEWFVLLEQLEYQELKKESGYLLALLDEGLSKQDIIVIDEDVLNYWMEWINKYTTWHSFKSKIESMILSGVKAIKTLEEQQGKTLSHRWFAQALNIMESSDDMNLSLDSVADSVNVHPVTLSRIFKQQMGMNFVRYLTKKRLEYAKHLLLKTNKKINEIAEEVGYADYPYFRNLFKKEYNYSPSEFRRNHGIASTD